MLSEFNIKNEINPSYFLISLCSLFLAGCSTAPREVSAQIPLLETKNITQNFTVTDTHYWSLFENNAISQIQFQQQNVQLGLPYTSALGLQCRSLHSTSNSTDASLANRVVCREAKVSIHESESTEIPWYMSNALMDSHTRQNTLKNSAQLNEAQ